MRRVCAALLLASAAAFPSPIERFATEVLAPRFFAWFASSKGVAKLHQEHVASPTVRHMIKGSFLASAPDDAKLDFARSAAGAALADFMRLEQEHIIVDVCGGKSPHSVPLSAPFSSRTPAPDGARRPKPAR